MFCISYNYSIAVSLYGIQNTQLAIMPVYTYGHVGSFFLQEDYTSYLMIHVCICIGKSAQQKVSNHAHACEIMRFSIAHHAGSEEEWLPQEDDRAACRPITALLVAHATSQPFTNQIVQQCIGAFGGKTHFSIAHHVVGNEWSFTPHTSSDVNYFGWL